MASNKDTHLYTQRAANIRGGKPISSNNSLSFTSSLSSLIGNSTTSSDKSSSRRKHTTTDRFAPKPRKDDLFHRSAKKAKTSHSDSSKGRYFEQKHTTDGERLERELWEKSQKKMQEKSRLYAAMKRGDVEDAEQKYGVDFDRKWAQDYDARAEEEGSSEDLSEDEKDKEEEGMVEYVDEFGRTRAGTKSDVARIKRMETARSDLDSDRYTSRPSAPSNIIRGDTIQHQAFQPDAVIADAMDELAKKRDRSLTPPEERHFDSRQEIRNHGTGFFQFSGDNEERKRQMDELEKERQDTERVRRERGRKAADEFLEELGESLGKGEEGGGGGTQDGQMGPS